jgi:Right handed beta helix region
MKRLSLIMSIVFGAGFVYLCPAPASAQLQVSIAAGTAGAITIVDGDANDTDPAAGAVGFEKEIVLGGGNKFIASGHAIQKITAGKDAELSFDRLTLSNTGANPVTTTIEAQTAAFAAIGPPFAGRVSLKGKYSTDPKGVAIVNSQVTYEGSATMPAPIVVIGTIAAPAAVNLPRPVPFNPPDVAKIIGVGVTQLRGLMTFTMAPHDRIVFPGSATVAGYTYDRELTVNSTADLADGLPGDGVCDTGNATIGFTGICTLRAALTEADQQTVVTAIHFSIPGSGVPRIEMSSNTTFNFGSMGALQQVIVDGTTQPAGQVEVDGSQSSPRDIAGNPIVGLDFVGQKSTVLGMVIHSFPSHGIQIRQSGTPFGGSNVISENLIGSDPTGQIAEPNGGDGVHITQMPGNLIQDNVIVNNGGQGVTVDSTAATGNRIHANSIVNNGALGIDLTNGGNNLQPAPVVSSAALNVTDLTVGGSVHGAVNTAFALDFFSNHQCDPSGSGEGETYLGSTVAATDGSGNATFSATVPADVLTGDVVTATATDSGGNTSEFSACTNITQVTPPNQPPVANAGSNQTVTVGTPVTLNGTGSFDPDNGPSPLTFSWTQTSGPAVTLTGANTATPSFTPTVVGTYVFSLVVNDGAAVSAPASVTITVVAPPPPPVAQQIQSLIAQVQSLGLQKGTENSLLAKLNAALASVNQGNTESARGQLGAFINEVSAQSGKKIPAQQAAALIAAAQQIIGDLA